MSVISLNPEQQAVVDHDGHCLVVACPGSGKTRVIVIKIEHLLATIPKSRVCAVTFTRDAANELKKRLLASAKERFGKDTAPQIVSRRTRVGTFHSLAIRQLRASGKIGKIASPAEQLAYVHRALAMSEAEIPLEEAVQIIETVKSSRAVVPEEDHPVYQAYASLLKRAQIEDLHDVLRKSLHLMQTGEVPPYPVEYMLVDEFQDTDEIQLAWVLEHVKAGTKVTVVGDDDQSVYSFRHALGYQGMERFRAATDAKLIALGTNYRCRSEVLNAAGILIGHNQQRIDKSLKAARGPGGSVTSVRYSSRPLEAEAVIEKIWSDVKPYKNDPWFIYTVPAGKWAVLARSRRTLDCVEQALHARRIRYVRPPSESIWSRQPFVFFISLLRSLQTGEVVGIDQALHFAGLAHDHIGLVHESMQQDLWRLLDGTLPPLDGLPDDASKALTKFAELAAGWRRLVREGEYHLAILGVSVWFTDRIKSDDERELFKTLSESVGKLSGSLVERVNTLTLPKSEDQDKDKDKDEDDAASGVSLMTMHGSKGLEFDNVWIIAAEEGVIPSPKNPVYDEERRLMYVGMTRAKNHLTMTSRVIQSPSPFVIECGYDPRVNG